MAAVAVPTEAERAHEVVQAAQPAGVLGLVLGELHQQQRLRRAWTKRSSVGRNSGISPASVSMVASTSSTAMGLSVTRCCAASIAA